MFPPQELNTCEGLGVASAVLIDSYLVYKGENEEQPNGLLSRKILTTGQKLFSTPFLSLSPSLCQHIQYLYKGVIKGKTTYTVQDATECILFQVSLTSLRGWTRCTFSPKMSHHLVSNGVSGEPPTVLEVLKWVDIRWLKAIRDMIDIFILASFSWVLPVGFLPVALKCTQVQTGPFVNVKRRWNTLLKEPVLCTLSGETEQRDARSSQCFANGWNVIPSQMHRLWTDWWINLNTSREEWAAV